MSFSHNVITLASHLLRITQLKQAQISSECAREEGAAISLPKKLGPRKDVRTRPDYPREEGKVQQGMQPRLGEAGPEGEWEREKVFLLLLQDTGRDIAELRGVFLAPAKWMGAPPGVCNEDWGPGTI